MQVLHTLEELEVGDCDYQLWNEDPHKIISFGNLHKVDVSMCQNLFYIFPNSLCLDLGHLEMLKIKSCGVKEIVAMEETRSMEINFNFPQLKTMALLRLTNLKSFYQGKHTLDGPSLKTLNVYHCEALRMFSFNNSDLQQPYLVDKNQDMLFQQALICIEKVNLIIPCFSFCMCNNALVIIFILDVYFSVEPQPGGIGSKWHRYVGDIEWLLSRKYIS